MGDVRGTTGNLITAVAWILVAAIIGAGAVSGVWRGLKDRPNWGSLQRESAYVWQHRETAPATAMFGYLPAASFALWPFTVWLPRPVGLVAYVASNVAAAVASLWIAYRWWGPTPDPAKGPPGAGASFVWPALLAAANLEQVIVGNQLTLWALIACMAGLTLVSRHRPLAGGLLVGVAALVKTLPFLLVGYLLLRRQWRAVAGVVLAVVLLDFVPSAMFFGWRGAIDEHRLWLTRCEWHSGRRQIEDPFQLDVFRHWSNFSYASVLTRWLRAIPDADELVMISGPAPADVVQAERAALRPNQILTLAPMPPRDQPWGIRRFPLADVPRFHLADLSARAVLWIWWLTLGVAACVLLVVTGKAGPPRGRDDWTAGAALWMLAAFGFTPMMRAYYLVLAMPALVVVWRTMAARLHGNRDRWTGGTRLAALAMLGWLIGVFCLGWHPVRWYGIHLGVVALLTAATAWAWRRARITQPISDSVAETRT